jgi:ATPase, YjeE family
VRDEAAWVVETSGPEETRRLAAALGRVAAPGDVLVLEGDLGAGKTTFVQGLAAGLGITGTVNSPTFTLIKAYRGRLPLFHIDVYRLGEGAEDLGFDEVFDAGGVTAIEWGHYAAEYLPDEYLEIRFAKGEGNRRVVCCFPRGGAMRRRVEEWRAAWSS